MSQDYLNHYATSNDARWRLENSGVDAKIVIVVPIRPAQSRITIETWELAPVDGRRPSTRAVPNLPASPDSIDRMFQREHVRLSLMRTPPPEHLDSRISESISSSSCTSRRREGRLRYNGYKSQFFSPSPNSLPTAVPSSFQNNGALFWHYQYHNMRLEGGQMLLSSRMFNTTLLCRSRYSTDSDAPLFRPLHTACA
jgi:hypothetical protein